MTMHMRTGRRDSRSAWGLALLAALCGAAPTDLRPAPRGLVGMTLEVDWSPRPAGRARLGRPPAELSLGAGRIVEVVAWPGRPAGARRRPDGSWAVGPGAKGRARARVEAPLGSDLIVRVGGQSARFPLASLPEGPQRIGAASPVEIGVERLAWDAIRADLGAPGFDGTAEPGARGPALGRLQRPHARAGRGRPPLLGRAEARPGGRADLAAGVAGGGRHRRPRRRPSTS